MDLHKKRLRGPILTSTTLLLFNVFLWTTLTGQPHKITEPNQIISGLELLLMGLGVAYGIDLTLNDWNGLMHEKE